MALTVPVLSRFPSLVRDLAKVLPNLNFHPVENPETDAHFAQSPILICDLDLLGKYLYTLPNVKWVQGTWAGVDKLMPYVDSSKSINYPITRFTGDAFGKIMSEYVVANIVNYERGLFKIWENQKSSLWAREGIFSEHRTIYDLTVGILGVGNIGSRVGKTLNFLGAKILSYGKRASLPEGEDYSHIHKYYSGDSLSLLLKESDYVINVLPNTPETTGILDNDILQNCPGSVLINIGRGNIATEDTIEKALANKWLKYAILDVFMEEPLPKSSKLWTLDNVFITPHTAGVSRTKDVAIQFKHNLELYQNNQLIPNNVDFSRGY